MRVSPITLVIFIVLTVFCIMFSYISYNARCTKEDELHGLNEQLGDKDKALQRQSKAYKELMEGTGYVNIQDLMEATGSTSADAPAQKLDDMFKRKISARDRLVKEIGVDITDVDVDGNSLYLKKTIENALAGTTPENLTNTLVGDIIEALRSAKRAQAEHDQVVRDGTQKVEALNSRIDAKEAETRKTIVEWDAKISSAWDARVQARNKLIEDRKNWKIEEVELEKRLTLAKSIMGKVDVQKAIQDDKASPADGTILTYDWKTKRGTIDLGAHDGIKAGYEFDVYHRHPGPDTLDRRTYHGKISIIEVKPEVSVIAVVASEYDKDNQPVRAGDMICSRLFDTSSSKKFYIAGYFPRGSSYGRAGLAGLLKKYGGTVQDRLALDTDYVVVGLTSSEGLTGLSGEAAKAIAKAKADHELAQRYNVTILTVDKLLTFIDRE